MPQSTTLEDIAFLIMLISILAGGGLAMVDPARHKRVIMVLIATLFGSMAVLIIAKAPRLIDAISDPETQTAIRTMLHDPIWIGLIAISVSGAIFVLAGGGERKE